MRINGRVEANPNDASQSVQLAVCNNVSTISDCSPLA